MWENYPVYIHIVGDIDPQYDELNFLWNISRTFNMSDDACNKCY